MYYIGKEEIKGEYLGITIDFFQNEEFSKS